mmetsp:Transcript_28183/g.32213  ORF Transcript_28183/g.32213 Transcript_28183/m.32213 type:complete len:383 (+) Transcript_28183:257-1405(+)|eukprot:CAMPEP_0194139156 /NCGR_PEP_ID=MMETSP0152-20130528/8883_1 /TAXON_ID=1049557 /ORGANISM="Thalassiothrix antarctica, Strain L6-D1" /LENGTH=382 /DNA_ID=CAMNT_0038836921 /DNA_START=199 /DNA_END=1347 /DNA_ORIENTATION=-
MKFSVAVSSSFLALSHFQKGSFATLKDFSIIPRATDPVVVNGIDDSSGNNEIDLFFKAGSADAAATTTCNIYRRDVGQCDLDNLITKGIVAKVPIVFNESDIKLPLDILLGDLNSSSAYVFSNDTRIGTFNFCGRCITTSGSTTIGYAETIVQLAVNQTEATPQISIANILETQAVDYSSTSNVDFNISAYKCTSNDRIDDSLAPANYEQGSYLEFCVKVNSPNVTCAWVENAVIDSDANGANDFYAVQNGVISAPALTVGTDKTKYDEESGGPGDGICYIKTQFDASIVPKAGTATMTIDGSIILEFKYDLDIDGRRFLRVDMPNLDISDKEGSKKRSLEENDQIAADYTLTTQVSASDAASAFLTKITYLLLVVGSALVI